MFIASTLTEMASLPLQTSYTKGMLIKTHKPGSVAQCLNPQSLNISHSSHTLFEPQSNWKILIIEQTRFSLDKVHFYMQRV